MQNKDLNDQQIMQKNMAPFILAQRADENLNA